MSINTVKTRIQAALQHTSRAGQPQPSVGVERELHDDELQQVVGGLAMLLPAVQKVREAALTAQPVETLSLNF